MSRNFGMGVQANLGGGEHPPARHRANTPRELPSGSILSVPPLERGNVKQAALDIGALFFAGLFVCSFASGIGLVLYVLFRFLRS